MGMGLGWRRAGGLGLEIGVGLMRLSDVQGGDAGRVAGGTPTWCRGTLHHSQRAAPHAAQPP